MNNEIARNVLEMYNAATVRYEEVNDEIAIDLIMDILHYCKSLGYDPEMTFLEALKVFHFEEYERFYRPVKCGFCAAPE